MKQKEEIQKAETELIKIKQELQVFENKIDNTITEKIDQMTIEIKKIYREHIEIKEAFVLPITDSPSQYVNGYSHLMKRELFEHHCERDQMWYTFIEEFKKIPRIVEMDKTMNKLYAEIDILRDTGDYEELTQKINDLKRKQKFKEEFIKNLKDIGWFRQHAKDIKERINREEHTELEIKRKEAFLKKIKKEYLPLMKKSADEYISY